MRALIKRCFDFIFCRSSKALELIENEINELRRRIVAFGYREEKIAPANPDEESVEYLRLIALEWKKNHPLIAMPILTAKEISHLKKTAEYSLFVALIKNYPSLKEKFLNWVLCDGNDVVPFIEFPSTIDKLIECRLSGRIGRYPHASLRIENKHLCLPFEGQYQNIMDPEAKITFRGGYTLKIEEIFQIFANKEIEVGNLEYLKGGICNWNIHHLAYWDAHLHQYVPIDLNQKKWWEQMPLFEVLTRRQMMKRYGISLKPHEWIVAAVATRGRLSLDYEETHAFLEVVIPQEDGHFAVYDFGKLATEYPSDRFEQIAMMTKTVHATVAYPDDNVFYTHRQRGFHPFALKNSKGMALMQLLKEDILVSRSKNMVYQIQSENCAKWVYTHLVAVLGALAVPDLFRMQLLDTEPQGPVALLFRGIKTIPEKWQVPLLMFLHLPLGAFRKIWIEEEGIKVAKSLSTHMFFKTGQIFLPALLIAKVMLLNTLCNNFKKLLPFFIERYFKIFQHFLINIFRSAKFPNYGIFKYKLSLNECMFKAQKTAINSTASRFKFA